MNFRWILVLSVVLGSGCDILSDDDFCDFSGNRAVEGSWLINGNGTFSDCEPGSGLNGPVSIQARSLQVIEGKEKGTLALVNAPEGFRLVSSQVDGDFLQFVTEEDTDQGVIRIEFTGTLDGCAYAEGDMSGTAPLGCMLEGSFGLDIDEEILGEGIPDGNLGGEEAADAGADEGLADVVESLDSADAVE